MPSVAQPSLRRVASRGDSSLRRVASRGDSNRLDISDRAAHDWYRFVLSFPPHLVRQYIEKFELDSSACVLDPFCGTGTTIVECKKLGFPNVGIEAHPMSHFASATKIDWSPDPDRLEKIAATVAERAIDNLDRSGIVFSQTANGFLAKLSL
jgi:DNA methylase